MPDRIKTSRKASHKNGKHNNGREDEYPGIRNQVLMDDLWMTRRPAGQAWKGCSIH